MLIKQMLWPLVQAPTQMQALQWQNPDTEIEVQEDVAKAFLFGQGVSLSDIVDSINSVGATSSDLVAILEALREAGALNAELIVI
jgi:flagellar P-ring protein precursor FlgI